MSQLPSLEKRTADKEGNSSSATRARPGKVDRRPSSILTLAFWRLRQTWGLLCMACVGFVAAMIIACVVPLFTTVATSSNLQSIFQSTPGISNLTLSVNTQGLSTTVASTLQRQLADPSQKTFAPYLQGETPLNIQQGYLKVLAPATLQKTTPLSIYTTDLTSLEPHLHLLAGRWPADTTPGVIEVLLTPQAAQGLGLTLGSELTLQGEFATADATTGPIYPNTRFTVRLVGLFQAQPSALAQLDGQNFLPTRSSAGIEYTLLASTPAFLNTLDQIAARAHSNAVFSYLTFQLTWNYSLQTSRAQSDQVDDLISRLATAQTSVSNYQSGEKQGPSGATTFPYVTQVSLYNPAPNTYELLYLLEQYSGRVALVSIPITILAVQIIALLLFFVSLLVDRQMATNALLSSRGASSGQVFWSLAYQGVGLCLLGVLLGPLAGTAIVSLLAQHTLAGGGQALNEIVSQPGFFFTSVAAPVYQVVGIVKHIPTIPASQVANSTAVSGGMLVDYHVFDQVFRTLEASAADMANPLLQKTANDFPAVSVTHLWLHTRDDARSLASVRAAVTSQQLALNNLYDRRAITTDLQNDPFTVNMLLILEIGAVTAFFLALVGDLIASWVDTRTRRSRFVVLRALGMTSRQIAGTLLWEQSIVYLGALALGLGMGIILTRAAVPVLVLTDLPAHGPMSLMGITNLYFLQQALPARLSVPSSLPLIFVALILICFIVLGIMIRTVLRPEISSELRLNED